MIFNYSLIHAAIRSSTPILFAGLASIITYNAGILNVGIEGAMLIGAFLGVAASYVTGSWIIGVLVAVIGAAIYSALIALLHLKYEANLFAAGTAGNILAVALTKFGLNTFLESFGSFSSPDIDSIPDVTFPFFNDNPVLNSLFNNYSLFEILAIVLVIVMWLVLYKSVWGLHLRSVGYSPTSAKAGGIKVNSIQWQSFLLSGVLAGLGGAYLSLGYTTQFVENMVSGRGFMGIAAMFFGQGQPILMWIGSLVFGLSDSIANRAQSVTSHAQLVLMVPYVVTIAVSSLSLFIQKRRTISRESAI